jgi:hypothetical protein
MIPSPIHFLTLDDGATTTNLFVIKTCHVGCGDAIHNCQPWSRPARLAASGTAHARSSASAIAVPKHAWFKQPRGIRTRGYADYWTRGGNIHRGKLSASLPRLPDSADEIKKIGEPSLALSIPANPSEIDDGLLTSSEVAQLKLNADWVVLSACNTMAGDKPGAEALSGLARAFFYAGTRALLVSHWTVESEAATRLTTSTFDIMSKDPTIGRAEALRRAMLGYLGDKSNDDNANPAYWGPFSVVGEGAVK